ncbi:hypothetical protein E8E13_002666 [Curvularia kusanoi]|uniref:Uncharacterized protein n=1 Tax=Curvularia kusanoi TaxID=90978 RepID=A0A9P4W2W0_CURKU|nr:hypothetical protein E8E13_002666 [Curvularia kusanoi]
MKRKFSFNLAPVKIPGKADAAKDKTPEPTPAKVPPPKEPQSQSHRRHQSKDEFPHLVAYISRQSLDARTERELRVACRHILQNFKPSDHGMEDTDPRLDFGAMTRRKGEQQNVVLSANEVRVRMPTGAPVDLKTALEARRLRAEAEAKKNPQQQSTLPVRTKSARQKFDDAFADERGRSAARKYAAPKPAPAETAQRGRPLRKRTESGDTDSVATPMTGSTTDASFNAASTAPSSAALTSGGPSNRHSHQLEPAAVADAQAAEWMRKELEKRRQQNDSPQQPSTANRPPSRARSIKDNIKEYFLPGSTSVSRAPSRAISRTQSRESLAMYDDDGEPKRQGSQRGWRSWGSALRVNSRSNSRPGTRGRDAEPEQSKKPEVNLNRELPPLPSLDSWKDEVKPPPELSSSHIASVMRAHDAQQAGPFSPTRSHHRRSGSDTLAVQYAQAYPHSPSHSHRSPLYAKQKQDSSKTHSPRLDAPTLSPTHLAPAAQNFSSSTTALPTSPSPRSHHARHKSTDNAAASSKISLDHTTFSRKVSVDTPDAFPNAVKLQKTQQQSRLKKVFTGWMTKKEKKDEDWMQRIEREGVKEGVLVQEGGAAVPVVRY